MIMKISSFAALAIALFASLTATAPIRLQRRAGVTCTSKYSGYLYSTVIASVTNTSDVTQRGPHLGTDDNDYLTHDINGSKFVFDECTTYGWNSPPRQFGQVKYSDDGDYRTLTANTTKYGSGYPLRIQDVASANNTLLDRQWFYAYWKNDKVGDPYVTLQLTGNPNDNDDTFDLPFAAYNQNISTSTKRNTGRVFTLFDVTILS
jgi:hypothetical protein